MDVQSDGGRDDGKRRGARVRVDEPQGVLRGKHTLVLTDDAWERLSVYAIKTKADCSELVEGLINRHLRGFVVQDRRTTPLPARPADIAAEVNGTVENFPNADDFWAIFSLTFSAAERVSFLPVSRFRVRFL